MKNLEAINDRLDKIAALSMEIRLLAIEDDTKDCNYHLSCFLQDEFIKPRTSTIISSLLNASSGVSYLKTRLTHLVDSARKISERKVS